MKKDEVGRSVEEMVVIRCQQVEYVYIVGKVDSIILWRE